MNSTPLVSVIIPCYNAGRFLGETLESVFCQTLKDFEVIVIDDGSIDNTASIIRSFGSRLRSEFGPNRGVSRARNRGTELANGKFIQYLDADDLLTPGKLEMQIGALDKSNAYIAYGPWQKLVEKRDGKYIKSKLISRKMRNPEIDLFTDFWCPPAAYLFRRSIIEKKIRWNEELPVIQDARFVLDCAFCGATFAYCPGTMAYYRVHSSDSISTRSSMEFIRDCFKNTKEIEKRWEEHGSIDKERKICLSKGYGFIAGASIGKNKAVFMEAYHMLERLGPSYISRKLKILQLMSRWIGYGRVEALVRWHRHIRE